MPNRHASSCASLRGCMEFQIARFWRAFSGQTAQGSCVGRWQKGPLP